MAADTETEKVTTIDSSNSADSLPSKSIAALEQIKRLFGIDVIEKIKGLGDGGAKPHEVRVHQTLETSPQ